MSNIRKIVLYRPCVEIYEIPRDVLENVSDDEIMMMTDEELAWFVKDKVESLADYYEGTEDNWDEQDYAIVVMENETKEANENEHEQEHDSSNYQ